MLGQSLRYARYAPAPTARHPTCSRKIVLAFAQQITAVQAATNGRQEDGKPLTGLPVQVSRPSLPCEKPLPLANVMEVQRLLFLLEAPEYCMRSFREHGVNGQDLLNMEEADLEDSRFKFPKHVQRKVLRIADAWRTFQLMTSSPTVGSVTLEQCVAYYHSRSSSSSSSSSLPPSPAMASYLQSAFHTLDVNSNGNITFEEFLVGFSLLEEAASMGRPRRAQATGGSTAQAATAPAAPSAPLDATSIAGAAKPSPGSDLYPSGLLEVGAQASAAAGGKLARALASWLKG